MLSPVSAENPVRCAVLGAGSFGTCLSILLAEKGYAVDLWARDPRVAEAIARERRNPRYLADFELPPSVRATASLEQAMEAKELVVSVLPEPRAARGVGPGGGPPAARRAGRLGVEGDRGRDGQALLGRADGDPAGLGARPALLPVGPSFARELAERRPTAVALASRNENYAVAAQALLSSPQFRCYTNSDVVGVELGGALKNVIAIAVGVADGMESGLNSRAALITRGLAEMTRLGVALGANPVTFLGLSGVGDLVLTCTGDLSRNRRVGLEIGRGRKVEEVLAGLQQVAEGVRTARVRLRAGAEARRRHADHDRRLPTCSEGKNPFEAALQLRSRQLKSETE